jgi:phosphatidate phosphatase APP1
MLKNQLQLLNKEFAALRTKITNKLQAQQQTITETTGKLNESNRKLELSMKEQSENERVLEKLAEEMKELAETLA